MTDAPKNQRGVDEVARRDAERVRDEYQRRARDEALSRYYERYQPTIERASAERRFHTLRSIDQVGPREGISILDVGCGVGADLGFFADQGFARHHLAGIDLLDDRVAVARASLAEADLRVGNGAALPYVDQSFDVVLQSVVLSSIIDDRVRSMVVGEMARVVRSGGLLISYDMRTVDAENRHLVPIDESEARRLFGAHGQVDIQTLTLNIGIARRVGSTVAWALARIPLLRTHLLAVVTRASRD